MKLIYPLILALLLVACGQKAEPPAQTESETEVSTQTVPATQTEPPPQTDSLSQAEMDLIRIADVNFISEQIIDYLKKTKELPLQSEVGDRNIQVFVTQREVHEALLKQAERLPIEVYTTAQLEADLEKGLGRKVELPSDPQAVPEIAPNVYIYTVTKDWACIAGHLHSDTDKVETKSVRDKYYKYEPCFKSLF